MGFRRCPGSVAFTQPTIELMRCPNCGGDAEVWSDEIEGPCTACGQTVVRVGRQSCVDWCKYARECLGEETYDHYQSTKSAMRKEVLLQTTAKEFSWGDAETSRARALVQKAEQLLAQRADADPNVVLAAVILRYALNAARPETVNPTEAGHDMKVETILEDLNYPKGFVKQVCSLVAIPTPAHTADANLATIRDVLSHRD